MKGVVLETTTRQAIILTDDGSIIRSYNRNYSAGMVVEIRSESIQKNLSWAIAIAACLIFMISFSVYAYLTPYSYVSLDINPSIQFTANRFSRVIDLHSTEEESEPYVWAKELRHQKIDEAVRSTIAQMESHGVFRLNLDNQMMVTVASKNMQHAQDILDQVVGIIQSSAEQTPFSIEVLKAVESLERVEKAREMGTTAGKLRLIELLRESADDPNSIMDEDWVDESVRNIMQQMNFNHRGVPRNGPGGTPPGLGEPNSDLPGQHHNDIQNPLPIPVPPVTDNDPSSSDEHHRLDEAGKHNSN